MGLHLKVLFVNFLSYNALWIYDRRATYNSSFFLVRRILLKSLKLGFAFVVEEILLTKQPKYDYRESLIASIVFKGFA